MDGSLSQTFTRWRSSGDPRLLAEVFDRASPELLRVAIHLVGEIGAAEDLVQSTFLTAIERAKSFDDSRRLEPWLAGILENHAHELARHAARTPDPERLEQRLEKSPLEEVLARELSAEVAAALDRLPEPYRRTLLLRVRHGLAPADIAHVLAESPGAVRVRLHRALEMLRKQLPAGIALGALFALEPARGMSSVKAAVLAAGGGGVLVMKKMLVGAGVLALLLLAWWKWPALPTDASQGAEPASAEVALESTPAPQPEALSTPVVGGDSRKEADAPSAAPAFHFRGQVVDGESGEPLAGATVELYPAQQLKVSEIKRIYFETLPRDWDGGEPGFASWPWVDGPASAAQRTDREALTVSAPPQAGEPALASQRTAADGTFELVDARSQGFFVCKEEGYATRMVPVRRSVRIGSYQDGHVVERTLALDSLLVRMYREYEVHGLLIDEQGERVHEKVQLRFFGSMTSNQSKPQPIDDPSNLGSWTVETGADGAFALRVAAPRVQLEPLDPRWTLCKEGMHPGRHERWSFDTCTDRTQQDRTLYVVVRRTPVLRVRDRDTHVPIENLVVIARGTLNGYASLCGPYFAPKGELRLTRDEVFTGQVLHQDLEPQEITVWADGYRPASVTAVPVPVGPDIEVELSHGELPVCEGYLRRGSEPLPGVTITLAPESSRGWYEEDADRLLDANLTDAQGHFTFRAPAGFFVLRIMLDGTTRLRSVELPLTRPLMIDLGREAKVVVHVRDASGAPRVNHVVSLSGKTSGQRIRHTDAGGDATFDGLVAGPCTVTLPYATTEGSFRGDFVKELELLDGQSTRIEAVIPADEPRFAHLVVAGESDLSAWRGRDPWGATSWQEIGIDGCVPVDIQKGIHSLEFQRGAAQRWSFVLPHEPPADLVLPIDLGGPAYDVEVVDSLTHQPVPGAVVVGAHADPQQRPGLTVSAMTDGQGMARLTGLDGTTPRIFVRLRSFDSNTVDLLRWDNGWGMGQFEPVRRAGAPPARFTIELPKVVEGRFADLPELHLSGSVRVHGTGRREFWVDGLPLLAQADGTLALHASGSRCQTGEGGHFELRMPLTARARLQVYDPESKQSLPPIEWEPAPGLTEQQRDFDFP
ncbi:MAG: sigma-70 family RNA polymerase sigma factor [Planctomycetes bacterium]|nr:sigma-70 family RNA polymerase sigma factor [Planctomycetota bacterium]